MTALKQTKSSTALVRILALPMMVGALAGCDYASKLPDAPSSLGGYDTSQKPPSVTGREEAKRVPPPADAFAKLKAPVEDRTKVVAEAPKTLAKPAAPAFEAPKAVAPALPAAPVAAAPVATLPVPAAPVAQPPLEQVAFAPLEFEAIEQPATPFQTAPVQSYETVAYEAPAAQAPGYAPLDTGSPSYVSTSSDAPIYQPVETPTYQPYDSAPLDTYTVGGTASAPEVVSYDSAPVQSESYTMAPVEEYSIPAPPVAPLDTYSAPVAAPVSPIAVLRARMPNGAVVNVHPVIGAPGTASATLARTVVTNIGAPINEAAARSASVAFDLRGHAERNTDGYVSVEWTLLDADKTVVGVFPERQDGSGWSSMADESLRAMGQRVADRIARNGELRKATLYAAANPAGDSDAAARPNGATTFILKKGATLASAPMPRVSPRASTRYSDAVRVASRPAPVKPAPIKAAPVKPAPVVVAPVARPEPVVVEAPRPLVQPIAPPVVVTKAPTPLAPPAPVSSIPRSPQVVTQAPRPVAPPPTFDTLRPTNNTQPVAAPTVIATGPRPLVFRGVQGAPGDGDVALSREVGKLLAQSGARMSATPQPNALFLTARVTKTPGANADRIQIVWQVQDSSGENIGQVTQANDVPRGMLDNAWGEDAIYAAEGARDGIMELLQGVGALDS